MNIISQIISTLISFFTQRQAQKTMEKSMEQSNKAIQDANEKIRVAISNAQHSMSGINPSNNGFFNQPNQTANNFANPVPITNNITHPLQNPSSSVNSQTAAQSNVIYVSARIQNFERKEQKINVNGIEYNQLEVDCLIQEKDGTNWSTKITAMVTDNIMSSYFIGAVLPVQYNSTDKNKIAFLV